MTCSPVTGGEAVLRMYWDDEATPSVEVPVGDFFCNGWSVRCNVSSLAVCVNPAGGFNCYWEMPFRKSAHASRWKISGDEADDAVTTRSTTP